MNENRRPAMANWGYQSLGPGFIQAAYHSQEYLDWDPTALYADWEEFMNDAATALSHIHDTGEIPYEMGLFDDLSDENVLLSLVDEAENLINFTGNKLYRKCPTNVTSWDEERRGRCIRTNCEMGLENILKYGIEAKQKLEQALNGERPESVNFDAQIFSFCPQYDVQQSV